MCLGFVSLHSIVDPNCSSSELLKSKTTDARPFVSHGNVRFTSALILHRRRVCQIRRKPRSDSILSSAWSHNRMDNADSCVIRSIFHSSLPLQEVNIGVHKTVQ